VYQKDKIDERDRQDDCVSMLQEEREKERRAQLFRITEMVFRALCTDPESGLPIDPRVIFRRLDTDGGGTVDIEEFRTGLKVCGCELTDEELELVWEEIDGGDGESDGQVLPLCLALFCRPRAIAVLSTQCESERDCVCVCVCDEGV
jgi:hypothetical protein